MTTLSTIWRTLPRSSLIIIMLIWPALYNGQPFFYSDTTAYIRGADAGVQAAFHHRTAWSLTGEEAIEKDPQSQADASPPYKSFSSIKDETVFSGRSPYYGALLYLGELTGGFWLSVILQSLAVMAALILTLRAAGAPTWPTLAVMSICIAAASSAPFFASFLMPDVFAGVAILAAAALLSIHSRLQSSDYLLGFALLAPAAVFHDSHALILAVLLALAAIRNLLTRSWPNWRGMAVIAATLIAAVLAQAVFSVAVREVVGAPPIRPPILMARTIEDGPGERYLRATCPGSGFTACMYLDRLPLISDLFLWEGAPNGVYATASPEVRRQLSNEDTRFAIAAVAYEPLGQLFASLKNFYSQLMMIGLSDFEYNNRLAVKIPSEHLRTMRQSAVYRGTMPLDLFSMLILAGLLASIAVIAPAIAFPGYRARLPRSVAEVSVWIAVAIVVNSAICGVLSGPHDRYSARVVWLIPIIASLIGAALLERKANRVDAAPFVLDAADLDEDVESRERLLVPSFVSPFTSKLRPHGARSRPNGSDRPPP